MVFNVSFGWNAPSLSLFEMAKSTGAYLNHSSGLVCICLYGKESLCLLCITI